MHRDTIPSPETPWTLAAHSGMLTVNRPSIWVRLRHEISPVHAESFTNIVSESGPIYQPLIHELRPNVETLVSSDTVLEKIISKEDH